jgi:pilus assembly protein Flp/PilA
MQEDSSHPRTAIPTLRMGKVWRDLHGQDLVEYGLAAGMVAVAAIAAMPVLGTAVSSLVSRIGSIIRGSLN